MTKNQKDLNKLCVHTITTKPWSLEESLEHYAASGIGGISVWTDAYAKMGAAKAGQLIADSPLDVVSLVRGGFFPKATAAERTKAIDDNKRLIEEAAALGAPLIVLVCGAEPTQSLSTSRSQIQEGIEALLPLAESLNIKLGIEPLHPMYADTRSAVSTLNQANDITEAIQSPLVGVVVDVYHLWWDERLEAEIRRAGAKDYLFAYHICDWKVPTEDMLNDRGLMGEGCINIPEISDWMSQAGFQGFTEVEIFSHRHWQADQSEFLEKIIKAYQTHA
ncbi:MAG: sugar phosphate isomerase/epimerase [Saprospiraceae bacterium]|nr:sugar phosphate isomerase/epimerase [Saprospiraceae bacterium]